MGWSVTLTVVSDLTAPLPAPPADGSIPIRVLVLGMARSDGTIHGSELYPVAEACGLSPEAVRSCLRRLVSDDLFDRAGQGRDIVLRATKAGRNALDAYIERTRLAYVQDAQGRGWDRRWRVIAFTIGENRRDDRTRLRDHLMMLGGAAVQSGVYVSPHDWFHLIEPQIERLGLTDHVTMATTEDLVVAGSRNPREIAARLWPIDDLAARYEKFLAEYGNLPDTLQSLRGRAERIPEPEYLAGALAMVVAFRECFDVDPLLPPELLPRPWPGRRAREVVADSHRLSLLSRQEHSTPALFRLYAEVASAAR